VKLVKWVPSLTVWVCGIASVSVGLGFSKLVRLLATPPGYGN